MGRTKPSKEKRKNNSPGKDEKKFQKPIQGKTITPVIPQIAGEVVPITSQLSEGNNNPKDFPHTARFQTISNVIAGGGLAESVKNAIHMGFDPNRKISCNCGPDVKCVDNPDCECCKTAKRIATKGQKVWTVGMNFKMNSGVFWNHIFFSCSSECSCQNCSMNLIEPANKNHNEKVEIARKHVKKGFGVFSKTNFHRSAMIGMFTGELRGWTGIGRVKPGSDNAKYMVNIFDKGDIALRNCVKACKFDKAYEKKLLTAYDAKTYIDPLNVGNFARFINHSCRPNLDMIRIFHGGMSPADAVIMFIAKRLIKVGEELTWDYGDGYPLNPCYCDPCEKARSRKRVAQPKKSVPKKSKTSAAPVATNNRALPNVKQEIKVTIKKELVDSEESDDSEELDDVVERKPTKQELRRYARDQRLAEQNALPRVGVVTRSMSRAAAAAANA